MRISFLLLILMTVFYSNTLSVDAAGPVIEIVIDETISVGTDKSNKSNQIDENIQIKDEISNQSNQIDENIQIKDEITTNTIEPVIKETPLPKTRAVKPTPTPSRRVAVEQKSNIDRSSDTKSEIRPTPTPERRSRWSSFFSRSSGRAVGMDSTPEEAPSTSGSCNSPGNDGLALLSMILLPIIFRSKSIFKPKKN
ncbi:MAG: hypothetical protein EGP10_03870 [SAR202 cluster bacterium]|nr:MAG: hypothetical protein EGP10_03870 [SAR202 cluster bacterium]